MELQQILHINIVQYGRALVIAMSIAALALPVSWLPCETCVISHSTAEQAFRPFRRYHAVLVPGLFVIAFAPPVSLMLRHRLLGQPL